MNTLKQLHFSKKIVALFAMLGLILSISNPLITYAEQAPSDDTSKTSTVKFLYDNGKLFDKEQQKEFKQECLSIKNQHDINTIILTDGIDHGDPQTFVEDFYDKNADELGDAIILYINMVERGVRIDGFGSCEFIFDNDTIDDILDEITPYLADEDCYEATTAFLDNVKAYCEVEETFAGKEDELTLGMMSLIALGISLLIGGISVGVMLYQSSAKMTATGANYLDPKHARILGHWERYIRTTTTRIPKPKDNNNNNDFGGGGGISSGGHSHSGGGRSF